MRFVVGAAALVIFFGSGMDASEAQEDCRKCVREKLDNVAEKTAAGAAIGAMGGAVGGLPGAMCGAILGAVAANVDKLIEIAQCETICKEEAAKKKDPQKQKCDDLMTKAKGG
jgi:outer membrane lipoprotein SlyB